MIVWEDEALVLSSISFSESSLILKVFTCNHGIRKGLVKGGKSKKNSYIYESGNLVLANYKSRTEQMLGSFSIELVKPCSAIYMDDSLKFSAIVSILNLVEFSLLENEVETDLYQQTKVLIDKILLNYSDWLKDYVRWEVFLLKKVGFGLELSRCTLTNKTENLKYLSPKSGCAVNEKAGEKWKENLFILPNFLLNDTNKIFKSS